MLARLLTPAEYGIMAMIAIFIAVSNSIVDSGFSNALIRKVRVERVDYNTVFYFNLAVSVLLYVLLFLASPSISVFFKEPELVKVTRVIGSVLVINALAIIPRTVFVRDVNFKTQTKVSLISSVSSGAVGIVMALSGMGVWSLVGQQLSRQSLNSLFLWVYCKWKPSLEFSIYYIVIGRFYSSSLLGQYTRAQQFNTIFSSNLTSVVQRVSYPVLSSIQEDPKRLREAYRKVIKTTMLITFACMLGLAAVSKPLIVILIGEKWLPSVYFLQIICFSGMLYPLHAINLNILQVKGRSDLFLKLEVIKRIIAIAPILIGVFYGIEYMLWGSVFTAFISYFLNSHYSARLIDYPTMDQMKDILPTFFISSIVAFFMWCVSLFDISAYILLPMQLSLGILLAFIIYEKLRLPEYLEVRQLVCSLLHRKNKLDNKQIWTKN